MVQSQLCADREFHRLTAVCIRVPDGPAREQSAGGAGPADHGRTRPSDRWVRAAGGHGGGEGARLGKRMAHLHDKAFCLGERKDSLAQCSSVGNADLACRG